MPICHSLEEHKTRTIKCWYWVIYSACKQSIYVIFDLIETYAKKSFIQLGVEKYKSSVYAMGNYVQWLEWICSSADEEE